MAQRTARVLNDETANRIRIADTRVRVYEYDCRAPISGRDVALEEMRRRVHLWNALVEVEQRYDERVDTVLLLLAPGADQGSRPPFACPAHAEEWDARRGRARFQPCPEQAKLHDAWRERRKAAFKLDEIKAELLSVDRQRKENVKTAYQSSGLHWCNYLDVVAAYNVARKRPGDLQFHSSRLERGRLSIPMQGKLGPGGGNGLPVARAFGGDNQFSLDAGPEAAYRSPIRGERRRLARSTVRFQVRTEDRQPVYLTLPVVLHRPLPAESLIKTAAIRYQRVGSTERWSLLLTVDEPRVTLSAEDKLTRPTVALDVGWRRLDSGLRVAFWQDSDGRSGELVLPNGWLAEYERTEQVRSIRDQHFTAARDALAAWLRQAPGVPDWLRERTAFLRQWNSPGRLASVVLAWRAERFHGDAAGFDGAEAWRKRDLHLWDWESHLRDQLLANRRDRYRVFSAWLARTYGCVKLEDMNLRTFNRRESYPAAPTREVATSIRRYQNLAAVSVLRRVIEDACTSAGVALERVDPAYTTIVCQGCGSLERFDAADNLFHTCIRCGLTWDQDQNAASNLLRDPAALREARASNGQLTP